MPLPQLNQWIPASTQLVAHAPPFAQSVLPPLPPQSPPSPHSHQRFALAAEKTLLAMVQPEPTTPVTYRTVVAIPPVSPTKTIESGSPWAPKSNPWALPNPLPPMEATVVGELFRAGTGAQTKDRWKLLNPQARSDLGFDEFLYQVRGCYPPVSSQYETLFSRLIELACDCPEDVYRAAFFEQLGELLGPGFKWAVFPKTKSLAGSGSSKPWW